MIDRSHTIQFSATLFRPANMESGADWTFLRLPTEASDQLPSRSMVSVEGRIGTIPFQATLDPDGEGGHWLKVTREIQQAAEIEVGQVVPLEISPVTEEPEPIIPEEISEALAQAPSKAFEVWTGITPLARRDWIQWITSAKKAETKKKRLESALDMLAKGKRRPCCFDRSGMYSKSLTCPVPLPLE